MIPESEKNEMDCKRSRAGGFTLVEMVVSVTMMAVILFGLGSAMLIAGRALPQANSPVGGGIAAAQALERMTAELQYAVKVSRYAAHAVEFAVADRDGNDVAETICYEWSGTSGDPLTRRYNTGDSVDVLPNVQEFDLAYELASVTSETPSGNESSESTLAAHDATSDLHDYPIKDTEWYAQYFLPALPQDAVSWRVSRVLIQAKQDGSTDGEARVQLQLPTAGDLPSGVVVEEKTLLESTLLSGYMEHEFTFSHGGSLSPEEGVWIVIRWIAHGTACKMRGRDKNVTASNLALAKSTNRGASWSTLTAQSLLFSVYGTVTTASEPQIQTNYYLDGVEIELRAGHDDQSAVQTGVRILNRPEVTQ